MPEPTERPENEPPVPQLDVAEAPDASADAAPAAEAPPEATPVGVQFEGVGTGPIIGFFFISLLFIAVIVWGGIKWFQAEAFETQAEAAEGLNYPDLRQAELEAIQQLNRYDVIDAQQGRYRIPLDQAIERYVEEATPPAAYSQELQLAPRN